MTGRLTSFGPHKAPTLNADLLPLFTQHFHLSQQEIAQLILQVNSLQKNDPRKLALLGFVSSRESQIPQVFLESLASEGLIPSLQHLNCSLKVENVHLLNDRIRKFIAGFYEQHQIPISINMYVTPSPEAPCFRPHCDLTEVFIYQLLGRKQWTFYRDQQGEYLAGQDEKSSLNDHQLKNCSHEKIEVSDEAILHVPPLLYHEVNCTQGASVHLTISLNRYRVEHLLRVLETALMEEMQLFKYKNVSNEEFEELFAATLRKMDSEEFKARLKTKKEQMLFLSATQILMKGR